jgi:hypothetical protein
MRPLAPELNRGTTHPAFLAGIALTCVGATVADRLLPYTWATAAIAALAGVVGFFLARLQARAHLHDPERYMASPRSAPITALVWATTLGLGLALIHLVRQALHV